MSLSNFYLKASNWLISFTSTVDVKNILLTEGEKEYEKGIEMTDLR